MSFLHVCPPALLLISAALTLMLPIHGQAAAFPMTVSDALQKEGELRDGAKRSSDFQLSSYYIVTSD